MSKEANNEIFQDSNQNNNKYSDILNKNKKNEEYELKIKKIKEQLKNLLKISLGKNLLNLESKTKEHIQILTLTTKTYNEFDKRIKLLTKQVEENKKKKEENKFRLKKIKAHSSKNRSKTVQMGNRGNLNIADLKISNTNLRTKKNNHDYKLINENIKPLPKIRSKTIDPRERSNQNSAKKTRKNINIVFHTDSNNFNSTSNNINSNSNNNTLKIKKYNSGKFSLTEQNFNSKNKNRIENNNNQIIKNHNNSKTKINNSKSKKNISSSTNILYKEKEKMDKKKYLSKKNINKKESFKEKRKSQDFSNKIIPKPRVNNITKKNIENFSEKKINSNKKFTRDNKNENEKDNEKMNEKDNLLQRFEKQKEMIENMRKQREINNLKEEEKRKEKEKEREEERIKDEERKKRERDIKMKEERLKEEERIKDEERKKRQMEIEAEIEKERIEKENFRKEIEKQREEEKIKKEMEKQREEEKIKKEIEKKREIERQKEFEKQKEKEKQNKIEEKREEDIKLIEKKKKEEERKKDIEKLKKEIERIEEEEIKNENELPQNMNFENLISNERNDNIDIQELLELEEQTDNSEFIHINEDKQKEINDLENEKIFLNSTPIPHTLTPSPPYYRNISIFELIHDVHNFGPCMFQFLDLKDLIEFTSISKKIKRQRIYLFDSQKNKILKLIGIEKEEILNNKIKEYEENYSEEELNKPYIEFQLSRGASRAVQLLNNDMYSKIFRRPVLDSNLSKIYIAYRVLFLFFGEFEIANIPVDKLFWVKSTEYLNSNSKGKIGDFIIKKIEQCTYDNKTIYYVEKMLDGQKDNIMPSYFSKFCGSTGLLIFLIKDLLEYCGIIISHKKTQISRIYNNLKYYKNIQDTLSHFIQCLENIT